VAVVDVIEAAQEPDERIGDIVKVANPHKAAVKLRIVERFKGVSPQQQEIIGRMESDDHEGVRFAVGRRYLLYTYRDQDGISHTQCSRSKLADTAAGIEEISQLRRCTAAVRKLS
jgi:hypothetical protein